jgi:molecular chaperone Hsp33
MAGSIRHDELVDECLSMEALVWRLFHEEDEVRVSKGSPLSRGCRCSADYYQSVLLRFAEEDRADMRDAAGKIVVDCEFCSRQFLVDA